MKNIPVQYLAVAFVIVMYLGVIVWAARGKR